MPDLNMFHEKMSGFISIAWVHFNRKIDKY